MIKETKVFEMTCDICGKVIGKGEADSIEEFEKSIMNKYSLSIDGVIINHICVDDYRKINNMIQNVGCNMGCRFGWFYSGYSI